MEQCLPPANVRGANHKEGSGILQKIKKNLKPIRSTAQSDREVTQSETTEEHGEETDIQKDTVSAHSELSASKDSLSEISHTEGSEILKKMKKNLRPLRSSGQGDREVTQSETTEVHGEETNTKKDQLTGHNELSASKESLSDISNTESSGILKKIKKNFRPLKSTAQSSPVTQGKLSVSNDSLSDIGNTEDSALTHAELSASNDSLSDSSKSSGILKKMFRPLRPAAQRDREVAHSEGTEDHGEEIDTRKGSLAAQSILSVSNDSLSDNNAEGSEFLKKMKKNLRPIRSTSQISSDADSVDPLHTHSNQETELEPTENTQKKGGKFAGMFQKSSKTAECGLPLQQNESTVSELSASNDSLPDVNTKEKGDKLTEWFRRTPKPAERTRPPQESESSCTDLSASNENLTDINTKEKGGMFSGMFRKPPKTSRGALPAQDSVSAQGEMSGNNDSLSDDKATKIVRESCQESIENEKEETDNRQEKALGGIFWKLPKDRTATFTSYVTPINPEEKDRPDCRQISSDAVSVDALQTPSITETELEPTENTQKKGGKFAGLFRKSPKPAENAMPVQEDESIQGELSASNDNLLDVSTKEKGGMFSGMFRSKSPKRSKDPTPAQDTLSANSELSGSTDSLSESHTKISSDADSVDPLHTHSTPETELEPTENTQKKGGKLTGLFRKSPKPAESTLPVQEDESIQDELSASNDNLLDVSTKEKGGMFSGMFRSRSPKNSKDPTPEQVSMDAENGRLLGRNGKRSKRRVSFRVKRTLPRLPEITLQSSIEEAEEAKPSAQCFEMKEMPLVQESSVEVEMVEIAPLPSESNLLDSKEEDDDDGLLDWWRTVEGWNEWNESSNFQEDEEELAVEQVADRVYLAAQLFVRLFNQRGASLQHRILELLSLADQADNFHKRALQASMGGRVASVVGSVTTITGLILAPFTFGSSIIVTAVGIGVATAGTITSASAHITDSVHFTLDRKKVEKMIEDYENDIKDIRECMDFVQEGMQVLQGWNFEKYTDSVAKRALNRNIKHVVKEGARAGKALMINTDKLVSTVQVLSVAGGAAKAAQAISVTTGVMSALFLALDIFFLAKDSHDLRKGAKTKFAKKLREVCKELQDGILELNRVKTALQKTMDGIEVEEYEEEVEEEGEEDLDLESDPQKLAELEEEINQIEQKLDQEVLEKKRQVEEVGRKEMRNDPKEDQVKSQRGKIEKVEKKVEIVTGEVADRVEKGKGESEGGKSAINEMAKEGNQGGNEERKKEKKQCDLKEEKREGGEKGESGKRKGDGQGKKERTEENKYMKNASIGRDELRKAEQKEGDEQWKRAERDSIPPPARPRSKAISQNTGETRWEQPTTAPPPVPQSRGSSRREPLSI